MNAIATPRCSGDHLRMSDGLEPDSLLANWDIVLDEG
jgi:hypothetical protein